MSYRKMFSIRCMLCREFTSKAYARKTGGRCKKCFEKPDRTTLARSTVPSYQGVKK